MTDPIKALADAARILTGDLVTMVALPPSLEQNADRLREALAAYDAAHAQLAHRPVGIAGERDPDHPCDMFVPGTPMPGICFGDGHYLCSECTNYTPEDTTNG